ncbi:hypothetical protein [Paenibacillus peoriae]|uniref:hypothetical protein n=1 Tax=Paenibacillus peoriae TaxID=59893 RepID=UPI00096F67BF|nr:hypothetical protein [Paenibacillus peoriae]OMF45813.1 hypothetical protein BK135_14745 [Paenibacillus peoriae]
MEREPADDEISFMDANCSEPMVISLLYSFRDLLGCFRILFCNIAKTFIFWIGLEMILAMKKAINTTIGKEMSVSSKSETTSKLLIWKFNGKTAGTV